MVANRSAREEQQSMARKLRIAVGGFLVVCGALLTVLGGAYYAARQVQPFYQQALQIDPEVLQRGSRELESRATALYSDAQRRGQWQALFTTEQINGWLAAEEQQKALPANIRDPRVAISPDLLTLGFRTKSGGVETVVSVDAAVFLTEEGAVGIHFRSVRAGALPLPMLPLAEEIAAACTELGLPVRWTQQNAQPVAVVEIHSDPSTDKRQFFIDSIELRHGELYVAGHTEMLVSTTQLAPKIARRPAVEDQKFELADYELRFTPSDKRSALQIARRASATEPDNQAPPEH